MGYRIVNFQLSEQDEQLLRKIAEALYTSKTNVVRWALRNYALRGPWCSAASKKRSDALAGAQELDLGPTVKGGE